MHFVDVAGARVAYRIDGPQPGSGTAVVMVHGTAGTGDTHLGPLAARFVERRTVVRPDYAGSGVTEDDGAPLTVEGLAGQVLAAADAAGLDRFHLLGYSLGAAVAVRIAADHPARVASLVPLSGFVNGTDSRLRMMLTFWRDMIDRDRGALVRHWILSAFTPAFLSRQAPQALEDLVALGLATQNWEGIRRQIDLDLILDIREAAARVGAPTLVVGCRQDQMVPPAHARELAAAIAGASYVELDSGHGAPLESPDALADLVAPFFAAAEREAVAAVAAAR